MVKAYVADWKKDEVSQLQDFVKSADVVGLEELPKTATGKIQRFKLRN